MGEALRMPEVGAVFRTGAVGLTRESVAAFAREYDPQAMHYDEAAAARSVFGRLVASGWQTAVLTMRLVVKADILGGAPLIGLEVKELKFAGPVRPGDALRAEATIEAARRTSAGDRGIVTVGVRTFADDGSGERVVLTQRWTVLATPSGGGGGGG